MRYLNGTFNIRLWYPRIENFNLVRYFDSDYVGYKLDKKKYQWKLPTIRVFLVSWSSHKQHCIALLTDVEHVAMCEFIAQLLWMMHTLEDFQLSYKNIKMLYDNINSINLTKNPMHHSRMKCIEVKHYFVQDYVARRDIVFDYVESKSNLTNISTKSLAKSDFSTLIRELEMCLLY